MSQLWFLLLYQPIVNALIFLYHIFGGNFGLAIIVLTVAVRLLLTPLTKPQLEASKKMQKLAPELDKLKEKYKDDKKKLMQAQMDLYKNAGVNPAAGCLPQIVQFLILIALFQAFSQVLRTDGAAVVEKLNQILYPSLKLGSTTTLNLNFLWLNLDKPDLIKIQSLPALPGIFLLLSVIVQFLSGKMIMPQAQKAQKQAEKTETKGDDFASAMQMQMLYMFPILTLFFGYSFPSGLVIYWMIFSLMTMIQQYQVFGWGGLKNLKFKIKN